MYATGNQGKINTAQKALSPYGVELEGTKLNIIEPQTDSIEEISLSKAKQAYKLVKKPIFVSDSGWYIIALKGFPGPFMTYINKWFDPQDFLNLMSDKKD